MKTIESFKERIIKEGDQVKVYFDLHRKTFSVQIGQRVHGKGDTVAVEAAEFKVNEVQRQKVIATKTKNVHAKVHGRLVDTDDMTVEEIKAAGFKEATYNPYYYESFVDKETKAPLHNAEAVILKDKRIYYK